jgi:NitT/TauT family transport system permease protein
MDAQLLEMARLFRLPLWRRLRRLYIPGLIPPFLSACSVGVGLAWKSGVAAEVISYSRFSIGGELKAGQTYLETADVFVWTIVVIILSLLIERLLTDLFQLLNRAYTK